MDHWYRPDGLTGRLAARNTKKHSFRFVLNKIFVEKKWTLNSEQRIEKRDVNFVIRFVREKMKDIGSDLVGMNIDFQYMRLCNHFHICSNIKYFLRDSKPKRFVMFPVSNYQW